MSKKVVAIIVVVLVLTVATVGLTAAMLIPSADELLTRSLETLEGITDGHAVVDVIVETPEGSDSVTFEVWSVLGDAEEHGALRLEVLEASHAEMVGLTAVTDGQQFWLYDPLKQRVITGDVAEMAAVMMDRASQGESAWPLDGAWSDQNDWSEFDQDKAPMDLPESPAEAVAKFLEYFNAERDGTEQIGNDNAYRLRLVPIPEKMPDELRANGGYVNLFLRSDDQLPLAFEYAEGAVGYIKIIAPVAEINLGLDDSLFTFDIPDGVEVVPAIELLSDMESRYAAEAPADFDMLTPSRLPADARALPSQTFGGTVVQRFTLPDGHSFVVAQGAATLDAPAEASNSATVEVRGQTATLYSDDAGARSLLVWQENGVTVAVGGDISPEDAQLVASSLR